MADETAHAVRITIGIAIKDAVEPTEESSDRKSTRLNSSHSQISYAVFCLKKKKNDDDHTNSSPVAAWLACRKVLITSPSTQSVMPGNLLHHLPSGTSVVWPARQPAIQVVQ